MVGAVVFIVLEHLLSEITVYWHLPFGLLLIASVLFLRGGLTGVFNNPPFLSKHYLKRAGEQGRAKADKDV